MMSEFKREDRYIVIKRKDLNTAPFAALHGFLERLQALDGLLPARQFLVIESDWPEYEPAWAMIEARMTGSTPQPPALGGEQGVPRYDYMFKEDATGRYCLFSDVAPLLAEIERQKVLFDQSEKCIDRVHEMYKKAWLEKIGEPFPNYGGFADKLEQVQAERDTLKADLASAIADKEAYAQNAIDLRTQVDALKRELAQLRAGGQVTKGELERLEEFKRKIRENRR